MKIDKLTTELKSLYGHDLLLFHRYLEVVQCFVAFVHVCSHFFALRVLFRIHVVGLSFASQELALERPASYS